MYYATYAHRADPFFSAEFLAKSFNVFRRTCIFGAFTLLTLSACSFIQGPPDNKLISWQDTHAYPPTVGIGCLDDSPAMTC